MKGVVRMVLLVTSTLASLACQGCIQTSDGHVYANIPAAEQSLGMSLAAPAPFGSGVMAPKTSMRNIQLIDGAPTTFNVIEGAVATVEQRQLMTTAPPSFDVSPSFARPTELIGPAWSGSEALVGISAEQARNRLLQPTEIEKNIAAEVAFSAPNAYTGLGFDLGVAPRISVREEGELLTQRFGGEVRIGQNIDLLEDHEQPTGWYIFAGGDGEALIWDANRNALTPQLNNMGWRDHVTVGDIQAGVSVHRAGGELSLSYIRREVKYQDRNGGHEEDEDFAGVSFTLRR